MKKILLAAYFFLFIFIGYAQEYKLIWGDDFNKPALNKKYGLLW
jgi:hypothetical protein